MQLSLTVVNLLRGFAARLPAPIASAGRRLWRYLHGSAPAAPDALKDPAVGIAVLGAALDRTLSQGGLRFVRIGAKPTPSSLTEAFCAELQDRKGGGPVAIVGDHPWAATLAESLRAALPHATFLVLDKPLAIYDLRKQPAIESVILLCTEGEMLKQLRLLVHVVPFRGEVLVPANLWGAVSFSQLENPRPILVCAYPCAGTNRFTPTFLHLLEHLKWQIFWFSPFMRNTHVLLSSRTETGYQVPALEDADEAIYWRARTLDYLTCMTVHEWLSLRRCVDLDCSIVVLMRDPRDIINSYFWHTRPESELSDEAHLLQIIDGYTRFHFGEAAYAFHWPNAARLVESFVVAMRSQNMHVIRFEDLHTNHEAALAHLMSRLGLGANPLMPISAETYSRAAYLGSFEYQTGGRRRRGEDHAGRPGGEHSGISTRKGVVGDWRSSFTPRAVERFKELTGNALVTLGYERDSHWQL